jgi:hypothetical protein
MSDGASINGTLVLILISRLSGHKFAKTDLISKYDRYPGALLV